MKTAVTTTCALKCRPALNRPPNQTRRIFLWKNKKNGGAFRPHQMQTRIALSLQRLKTMVKQKIMLPPTRCRNLDKAIGSDALRVLAYALGRPPGWRLRFADVKKRFGWNRRTFQSAMRELEQVGYAALSEYHPSFGQCWHVREHPAIPWPKGVRFSAAAPAARLLCCTETAQHNKDLNYSKRGGVENRSSLKKESSNEQANASCERTASQLITSPLADYSEENREKIAIWHKKVCDKRPHWLRINKYTERTEQALDKWDVDDFREFCRKVARIRLRNKRDHGEGEAIGILIPKRKTLVNLLWTND